MAEISIVELTEGTVDGTGYFDELMKAVTAHLEEQHKLGRIKGADYSTVYLGAMQYAMQQAVAFALGKQQADKQAELLAAQKLKTDAEELLIDAKTLTEAQQTILVQKQQDLYVAQTNGFARDAEQKAVKAWVEMWTIARSTDPDAASVALPVTSQQLNELLEDLAANAGFTVADYTPA